jgi:adenosylhomocysteine nucleosidase
MLYFCAMNDCIAIFGAVKEEIAGIKQAMNISDRVRLGKTDAWPGKWKEQNIVLVRSGVGKQRAEDSVLQVIDRFQPTALISTGYAGAVQPELGVGDLVIADAILEEGGGESRKYSPDPHWLNRAEGIHFSEGTKIVVGGLLTVNNVIYEPAAKRELGKKFSVQAVEMETSAIARVAEDKGLPLLSVRVISDSMEQELLDSSSFLGSDGEISTLKAGWYVLTHPGSLKSALSLRAQTQFATQTLTRFLSDLLD